MKIHLNLIIAAMVVVNPIMHLSQCYAEEKNPGDIGRLRDGRAYRVDESGFQITDQLADLEVTVDELTRQVEALENELALKQQQLDAKSESGSHAGAIQETVPQVECKPVIREITVPSEVDCTANETPLRETIAKLEKSLQQERTHKDLAANKATEVLALQEEISNLQAQADTSKSQFESREGELISQLSDLQKQVDQSKFALENANNEIITARNEKIIAASKVEEQARGRLSKDESREQISEKKSEQSHTNLETNSDLLPEKKIISEVLNEINRLIVTRKDKFDALRNRKQGVLISLQPLKTTSGVSLDTLRVRTKALATSPEANGVKAGVLEIKQKLSDDIQTMNRLGKL